MKDKDIKQLKISDKAYPEILRQIPNPPQLLYYRGNLEALSKQPAVAVVGTRRCSEYGRRATEEIVADLAKAKVTIVSGLAKGIDTYAHKTALEHNANTIAVLGTGLDDASIYPQRNKKLAHEIINSGGILLSEYEPETPGYQSNFPERNRIVAGLSEAVLAVEAPLKSGTMITAKLGRQYKKDVYAVPGSIFSRLSEGCNKLILSGAMPATKGADILDRMEANTSIKFEKAKADTSALSKEEKLIYDTIAESGEALHIDKLVQKLKLDTAGVSAYIASLMLEDLIEETEPNHYIARQ